MCPQNKIVNGKDINRNLLLGKVINYWLFKNTYTICSERWPFVPVSLLHRLSCAIYSWLFTSLHIDLKCNEQNHTNISQQNHRIHSTSLSKVVLRASIFQKLNIMDTPTNYSGTLEWYSPLLVWLSHSTLWCSYYYNVIMIIVYLYSYACDGLDRGQDIQNGWNRKYWQLQEQSCSNTGILV